MSQPFSLRRRLFVSIMVPLLVVAGVAGLVRYWNAEQTTRELYDNTLSVVALTISRDVALSDGDRLADELVDRLVWALGDAIYYRVTGPDGRFLTGYANAPAGEPGESSSPGQIAFFDSTYYGDPVRVATLREYISDPEFAGWMTVEVWQTVNQRDRFSLGLTYQAFGLMAAVILTAAVLVWFGVSIGLGPLTNLREAILLRSPSDLRPIRRVLPREIKPLVDATNLLFRRLSDAFAQRDAFISDAAHQLRNPVAGIQAQAEAAAGARTEPELRERISEVADAAKKTSRLTQQLLSLDKATQPIDAVSAERIDLREVVASVARKHAPAAMRRGAEIVFEQAQNPVEVGGDRLLLGEAIDNLIDNAVRYGPRRGGTVRLNVTHEDGAGLVVVEDDGPGIPGDQAKLIFQRFHRVRDDGGDGCGLGLAIVRTIAERHGGSIELELSGKGARFNLRLPLLSTASATPDQVTPPA